MEGEGMEGRACVGTSQRCSCCAKCETTLEKPECWTPVTSTLKCLRATGLAQFTQLWHSAFWEQTCLEEWVQ